MHVQEKVSNLRDRRRVQTYRDLHQAAVAVSFEDGIGAATIESITKHAGVSKRTFFNYFATKEDAILGVMTPTVPKQAAHIYFSDDDTDEFSRVIRLVVAVVQSGLVEGDDFDKVHESIRRFPELRSRFAHHFTAVETVVGEFLGEHSDDPRASVRDENATRAIVAMALTVLKHAYRDFHLENHASLEAAIESAITTFRTVLKEIL